MSHIVRPLTLTSPALAIPTPGNNQQLKSMKHIGNVVSITQEVVNNKAVKQMNHIMNCSNKKIF